MLPWGGPAAQAKAPVKVDIIDIFATYPFYDCGCVMDFGSGFLLGSTLA